MTSQAPLPTLVLSPRVLLHSVESKPTSLKEGWIALSQFATPAFGDGTHPTTRLCAGAVDFICKQKVGLSVLDVGTGTGILSRIARARGASFIVGTDIDPSSILAAQAHVALDHHEINILIANAQPDSWGSQFQLVVANILESSLRELAPSLSRALAPGGILLLSGFTRLQIPALRIAFNQLGLLNVTECFLEDWALLMFRQQDENNS